VAVKLTALKTQCESMVQTLKQKGIDGKVPYEEAQRSANECVGYLTTSIADRGGSKEKVEEHLKKADEAVRAFLEWSNLALLPPDPRSGKTKEMLVPAVKVAAVLGAAAWSGWTERDRARKDALIKELEKCKFRSWHDIR
jgi:hypothetical protein